MGGHGEAVDGLVQLMVEVLLDEAFSADCGRRYSRDVVENLKPSSLGQDSRPTFPVREAYGFARTVRLRLQVHFPRMARLQGKHQMDIQRRS